MVRPLRLTPPYLTSEPPSLAALFLSGVRHQGIWPGQAMERAVDCRWANLLVIWPGPAEIDNLHVHELVRNELLSKRIVPLHFVHDWIHVPADGAWLKVSWLEGKSQLRVPRSRGSGAFPTREPKPTPVPSFPLYLLHPSHNG